MRVGLTLTQINKQKTGAIIKHYGPTHLKNVNFPLPSLKAQNEIVEKINYVKRAHDSALVSEKASSKILNELIDYYLGGAN